MYIQLKYVACVNCTIYTIGQTKTLARIKIAGR